MPNKKLTKSSKKNKTSRRNTPRSSAGIFTYEEQHELAAQITPFAPESDGARICDDKSNSTVALTLHFDSDQTSDASGLMQIQLAPYGIDTNARASITLSKGAAPAASTLITCREETPFALLYGDRRVVGAAIRVSSNDPTQLVQGRAVAGLSRTLVRHAVAQWTPWADMRAMLSEAGHYNMAPPDDGCQVRLSLCDEQDFSFKRVDEIGVVEYTMYGLSQLPTILLAGLANAQTVHIEGIVHLEYIPTGSDLMVGTPSPFGVRHGAISAVAARAPVTASGHSFVKWAKIALTAAKVMSDVLKVGIPLATHVAPMIMSMF